MQFRTTFSIPESLDKISHQQNILTIGSCFSDEIGGRLVQSKFKGLINPFGVIFNAFSIENLVERSINLRYYTLDDVHQNGEQFFCYDVHSSFNALTKEVVLSDLNATLDQVHHFLKTCDVLILTLGTSWVYQRIANDQIVANCHKVEAKKFEKRLLTTEENFKSLDLIVFEVLKLNPKMRIITTVSPVRHTKDGMVENNVSKSRLIDALYQLDSKYDEVDYFPSYELVMDDLRDYRFYKDDLIHPSTQAVNYIWEQFSATYFSDSTITLIQKINKINAALAHRPFNEEAGSHQKFLQKVWNMMVELEKSGICFEAEKEILSKKIQAC